MIGDSDVAHPPRAGDFHGLLALQKKRYPSDEGSLELRMKSEASIRGALTPASEHVDPKLAAENQDINIPESGASVRSMEHAVSDVGLKPALLFHNRPPAELYEMALRHEAGTHIVQGGALATVSGAKTGRSPKDKRVVRSEDVQADLWWGAGSPNIEMDDHTFMVNRERAIDYLNTLERVHVQDGFVSWDVKRRFKIRVICGRAYHALFMHNMLIRPSKEELREFGEPDFTIYNAGAFPANRHTSYMSSSTSVDISLSRREMVILGTQYAGEMKKGVFSVMHYFMPRVGILSLHSGCNVGADDDVTLFFGLSGTGKTTLSTDPRRPLIGDDEHGWGDDGVFNLEGGCYAKCINLSKDKEPEIYEAIRFGAVLENVIFHDEDRSVDYDATSITENTRAAYPIEHIANARIPCVGPHPRNIILLSCDAFGVLPPVSRLTTEQACYHFISGYTAKVAGTEVGVKEPEATFSACFGGAFLMWHPMKYASMLAEKMEQHKTACWLVNTGWTGGAYGTGSRISLSYTRAIIDAIHSGALGCCDYTTTPVFALQVPTACPGVPDAMLLPEQTWPDKSSFWETLHRLGQLFQANFATYASGGGYVSSELAARITAAGPDLAFVQQVLEGGARRPDPLGSAAAAAVSTV